MDTAQTNLFYRISQYRFMCVELNLYLDTHPNDENAGQLADALPGYSL